MLNNVCCNCKTKFLFQEIYLQNAFILKKLRYFFPIVIPSTCCCSSEFRPSEHGSDNWWIRVCNYLPAKKLSLSWKTWRPPSLCQLVVAWGSVCKATHKDVAHLQSNQEEAITKMTLHALDATANAATQLQIHSPDTDVFVLALRRYPELCENTLFVTGRGQHHRVIELKPIAETPGPEKIAALPAFHALSGADNTGSFFRKGKASLLEDNCRRGFINYHCPCRTWTSCLSKWRNCSSHWEVCLSAISTKNKPSDC